MIKISNLSKSYGKQKVLDNLSCTIKTNSIYGFVGANGAGKSTLLRLINDVYRADSGTIEIDGKKVQDNQELKQKLVFVPDDLYFFPNYTLKDMAEFYAKMYKNFNMEDLKNLAGILKLDMNSKIQNFSKGMKRQCAIICAMCTNADYMFFDETFDGIDPVVRNLLKKMIAKQMNKKETTVILTSHNLRELEDICDNLALIYKGGVLFESDVNALKTNVFKVQISLKNDFSKEDFKDLEILNFKKNGSVAVMILKGEKSVAKEKLEKLNPVILDFLPVTLEEMFIYEMEVLGYEFNQVF